VIDPPEKIETRFYTGSVVLRPSSSRPLLAQSDSR
jgi:hypothetical protein